MVVGCEGDVAVASGVRPARGGARRAAARTVRAVLATRPHTATHHALVTPVPTTPSVNARLDGANPASLRGFLLKSRLTR